MSIPAPPSQWRSPEELVAIGFERSRVVMMNEAHNGLLRCVRTREIGRRVLPTAHEAGVRHLAMEALLPQFAEHANAKRALLELEGGYLSQPEMRGFIEAALELGWTLIPYEVRDVLPSSQDPMSVDAGNWRDRHQARNLTGALARLGEKERLLVWCGNGHLSKRPLDEWRTMALIFSELTNIEPFSIDQTQSVVFGQKRRAGMAWVEAYHHEIDKRGGAAGFLAEDPPQGWSATYAADSFILATDNTMV